MCTLTWLDFQICFSKFYKLVHKTLQIIIDYDKIRKTLKRNRLDPIRKDPHYKNLLRCQIKKLSRFILNIGDISIKFLNGYIINSCRGVSLLF